MSAVPCSARLRTEFGIFPAFINLEVEKCTVYMNYVLLRNREFLSLRLGFKLTRNSMVKLECNVGGVLAGRRRRRHRTMG